MEYKYDKTIDDYNSLDFKIKKRKELIKEILLNIEKDKRQQQDIINKWWKKGKKKRKCQNKIY